MSDARKTTVALDGVEVRLGGRQVLAGVRTGFESSRVTAIVGPNGAGKTTLLRSVIGTVPLRAGTVRVDGEDRTRMPPRRLARSVALVPQDIHVDFSFRVKEVVMMGRYPHLRPLERERASDREIARDAMRLLGVEELGERDVTTLSEGECQRVLVARALATGARTLLLDEPISHLDVSHRLDLLDLLRDLAADGRAVVVVLHDLDLAMRYADHIIVIDHGAVAGEGAPGEMLGLIEGVFAVRVHVVAEGGERFLGFSRGRDRAGREAERDREDRD